MAAALPPKVRDRLDRALATRDPSIVRRDFDRLVKNSSIPAVFLYRLGMLEAGVGGFAAADRLLAAAGSRAPADPTIRVNRAQIKLELGDGAAALSLLEGLPGAARANPAVLKLTGDAALAADRPEDAATAFAELVSGGGGGDPAILTNFGTVLRRLGRFDEAARHLGRAIDLGGGREAVVGLAGLHIQLEQPGRAVDLLTQHVGRRPDDPILRRHLASAIRSTGDGHRARRAAYPALILAPGDPQTLAFLAESAENAADLDTADRLARQALAAWPDSLSAGLVRIAVARRRGDRDGALAAIETWLDRAPPASRHLLLFEQAKVLDGAGDIDRAMAAFTAANAAQRETARPRRDPARAMAQAAALTALHRAGLPVPQGQDGDDLLFVVGFPRSGTTLLDQVMDAHPAIEVIEERPLVAAMIADLTTAGRRYPDDLPALSDGDIADLRARYRQRLATHTRARGMRYTVDKMPLNLVHVALIRRVFPGARFVLALRHPCDVVLSCFMQSFALNDWMAAFATLEGSADLYRAVFQAWESYRVAVETPVITVRYEDVVEDLEREATRLTDFLDLPFDPAMLAFHQHARTRGVLATPSAAQVSQPIYRTALGRWRRYAGVMDPIAARLAPEIARFGYAQEAPS